MLRLLWDSSVPTNPMAGETALMQLYETMVWPRESNLLTVVKPERSVSSGREN